MNNSRYQMLDEFEILKKVVNKEIDMTNLSNETKIRLIGLCENRMNVVDKKINTIISKITNQNKN